MYFNKTTTLNNYLLIAGNGRNIGKTWLSERCISQLAKDHTVIGIKIASHTHQLNEDIVVLDGDDDKWMIGKESNYASKKDSGRMLSAGASIAYYAQLSNDNYLPALLNWLQQNIGSGNPVVCESAALGKYIIPGAALFVSDPSNMDKTCTWQFPYTLIQSEASIISNPPNIVQWEKNNWLIK